MYYHRLWHSLCLGLLLTVGCGGPKPPKREYADVTGKVTYKGEALKNGTVMFQPAVGASVVGDIETDGTYRLQAVIGMNTIMISNRQADPGPGDADPKKRKEAMAASAAVAAENAKAVPEIYGTPASGLKFDVKAGKNEANFDLK